jgi:hypothetical protein
MCKPVNCVSPPRRWITVYLEEKALTENMRKSALAAAMAMFSAAPLAPALAKTPIVCGGAVLLNGAQLLCSHVDPTQPAQLCTYSWALATSANQVQVVSGSFLLQPKMANVQVYSASGFAHAMSEPIVLCQGKKSAD